MTQVFRIIFKTVVFYSLVVLGATFVMFTLLWAAPGDLSDGLCPRGCSKERKAQIAKEWGLDQPLMVQYYRWLKKAAKLDFGTSVVYRQGQPIKDLLKRAVSLTVGLVFGAAFLSLLFSFFLLWRPVNRFIRALLRIGQYPLALFSFVPLYILAYWMVMASSRIPFWIPDWLTSWGDGLIQFRESNASVWFIIIVAILLGSLFSIFFVKRPWAFVDAWLERLGKAKLIAASGAIFSVVLAGLFALLLPLLTTLGVYLKSLSSPALDLRRYWIDIELIPFGTELEWTPDIGWLFLIPFLLSMILLALGNNNLVEQASGVGAESTHLKAQDFMRAVRSKGASWGAHLLHNMLLPLTQFFTTRAILLLGTVVIIESIMGITGVGWLLWEATKLRDTPLVLAIALFATVLACLLQMLNEIALQLIDPRLRKDS